MMKPGLAASTRNSCVDIVFKTMDTRSLPVVIALLFTLKRGIQPIVSKYDCEVLHRLWMVPRF